MATFNLSHLSSDISNVSFTDTQKEIASIIGDSAPVYVVLGIDTCRSGLIAQGVSSVKMPKASTRYTRLTSFYGQEFYPRDLTYKIVTSLEHLDARTSGWIIANNKGYELAQCLEKLI